MKVRPLNDRVLVKRLEEEEKTSGGLYIPDSAKEKPQRGVVVAVGKGKLKDDGSRIEPDVAKGDEVLFGKYAGTEISLDGVDLGWVEGLVGAAFVDPPQWNRRSSTSSRPDWPTPIGSVSSTSWDGARRTASVRSTSARRVGRGDATSGLFGRCHAMPLLHA